MIDDPYISAGRQDEKIFWNSQSRSWEIPRIPGFKTGLFRGDNTSPYQTRSVVGQLPSAGTFVQILKILVSRFFALFA